MPELTLHVLPPSHPCMTVEAALRFKGLGYERVALTPGPHVALRHFPDDAGRVPAGLSTPAGFPRAPRPDGSKALP